MSKLEMKVREEDYYSERTCSKGGFKWENLPLEVYEVLVPFLDKSLINLSLVSPTLAAKVQEPFTVMNDEHREHRFQEFCLKNLDRSLLYSIHGSFHDLSGDLFAVAVSQYDGGCRHLGLWESIFSTYVSFWAKLTQETAKTYRLGALESKLKAELLLDDATFHVPEQYSKFRNRRRFQRQLQCLLRIGIGRLVLSIIYPSPFVNIDGNLSLTNSFLASEVECVNVSPICPNESDMYGVKIVNVPKFAEDGTRVAFDLVRLVITACTECLTVVPLLGGVTRKSNVLSRQEALAQQGNRPISPVFEVHENVVVIWPLEDTLKFILLDPMPDEQGVEIYNMYSLKMPEIVKVWEKFRRNASDYLAVIREIKGDTPRMSDNLRKKLLEQRRQFCSSAEPVYYGLSLVSPIKEAISLLPSPTADEPTSIIENWQPMYCSKHAQRYVEQMESKMLCHGKGLGMFVFCSSTVIAVSWNGGTWAFTELEFPFVEPSKDGSQDVSHVEVVHINNGILLVVNGDIVLAEVSKLTTGRLLPNQLPRTELQIKPLRHFRTGLASLQKQVRQIELGFDGGQPFFLVIAEDKPVEKGRQFGEETVNKPFSFSIMRITFDNQTDFDY